MSETCLGTLCDRRTDNTTRIEANRRQKQAKKEMFKMGCSMARKILAIDGRGSEANVASGSSAGNSKKSKDKHQEKLSSSTELQQQQQQGNAGSKKSGDELNDFSKLEADPRIPLNVRQIFKITKSWKAIARTMSKTGTAMFLNLFEQNQDLFYLFARFQHLKGKELHNSMELQEHAATVMSTLDQSINSLSDYDNFVSYLHSIGKLHRKIPGFKRSYFWKIEQPFLKAVKQTLDERCNETIEEIYKIAIKLILETIAVGYGAEEDAQAEAGAGEPAGKGPPGGENGGGGGGGGGAEGDENAPSNERQSNAKGRDNSSCKPGELSSTSATRKTTTLSTAGLLDKCSERQQLAYHVAEVDCSQASFGLKKPETLREVLERLGEHKANSLQANGRLGRGEALLGGVVLALKEILHLLASSMNKNNGSLEAEEVSPNATYKKTNSGAKQQRPPPLAMNTNNNKRTSFVGAQTSNKSEPEPRKPLFTNGALFSNNNNNNNNNNVKNSPYSGSQLDEVCCPLLFSENRERYSDRLLACSRTLTADKTKPPPPPPQPEEKEERLSISGSIELFRAQPSQQLTSLSDYDTSTSAASALAGSKVSRDSTSSNDFAQIHTGYSGSICCRLRGGGGGGGGELNETEEPRRHLLASKRDSISS